MNAQQYLKALRDVGWFEGLPPDAASDVETNVTRAMDAGEAPEPWPQAIWFDCESIVEPGDYRELLDTFASGSYGMFTPENVRELWDDGEEDQVVHLSFEFGGRRFERTMRGEADWVAPDFFDLLDEAMETAGGGLVFGDVDTGDQTALFFLCNAAAFERAEELGLLPEIEPDSGLEDE